MLTADDVAREAGVSRATVSYVLNGRLDVRVGAKTRARVMKVAQEMGYIGSPSAKALRSGRGDIVLLLIPDWDLGEQFSFLLGEVGRLISQHSLVCLRHEGRHWKGALPQLLGRVAAACVVTFEPLSSRDSEALSAAGLPEVPAYLFDHPGHPRTTELAQADIITAQAEHLLETGAQRLGYLIVDDFKRQDLVDARVLAYEQYCQRRGIPSSGCARVSPDLEAISQVLLAWTQDRARLGVVAWNDLTAVATIHAAISIGLEVPTDFSLIGGDDTLLARLSRPSLTSIRLDLTSEAVGIVRQVLIALGMAEGRDEAPQRMAHVVVRDSTRPVWPHGEAHLRA